MAKLLQVLAKLNAERERVRQDLGKLDKAIAALEVLGATTRNKRRRKLSVAVRKKIAGAQRARWAKLKFSRQVKGSAKVSRRVKKRNGGSWGGPLARKDRG